MQGFWNEKVLKANGKSLFEFPFISLTDFALTLHYLTNLQKKSSIESKYNLIMFWRLFVWILKKSLTQYLVQFVLAESYSALWSCKLGSYHLILYLGTYLCAYFVLLGDFNRKSYKWNFMSSFWNCVLVEFVLVETVLVGDPLYMMAGVR